jgi:hypothetical protein
MDPLIYLTRHVEAVRENNSKPYAVNTIRDGVLRPITTKQLKDALYLTWANKDTQAAAKEYHNAKIRASALKFIRQAGAQVDWTSGAIRLENRNITAIE